MPTPPDRPRPGDLGGSTAPSAVFLDRDGVINRRVVGDYVRTWDQFEFLPGVLEALALLAPHVEHLVVVTNQQGVGKGLMSDRALSEIHDRMRAEVAAAGGRIDAVLRCPHLATDDCACRKPRPGLVAEWLAEHPDVSSAECVMVGDTVSDLQLAAAWPGGPVQAVLVDAEPSPEVAAQADLVVADLLELAHRLGQCTATRRPA